MSINDSKRPAARRRIAPSALAAGVGLMTSMVPAAAPAEAAATPGVYIVAPRWWGWCPNVYGQANWVEYMDITNVTNGYGQVDRGDDVGWAKVILGRKNEIHVNVGCGRGIGSTGTVVWITPNRNGQTFWTSPSGASYGN